MKRLFFCLLAVVFLAGSAEAALTYGASYYQKRISNVGSGDSSDPLYLFINEVETKLDGTTGVASIIFTPGSAPTGAEGKLYYDSASHGLVLYTGASGGWKSVDTAGASSLDTAYNNGVAITVDAGSIVLTAPDSASNTALTIAQADTSTAKAFVITNAGTGNSIDIQGQASAYDIEGTDNSWHVSTAGLVVCVGVDTTGNIVLQNDEIIKNDNNGEIEFGNGTEDTAFSWGTNTLQLTSDTDVATIDFGDLDAFTGVESITFDAAAGLISLTADATAEDLVIQQYGAVNASLILYSKGTAADSIKIYSDKGIDIDSVDDMAITNTATTTADDFVITQAGGVDASLILTSAGTGTDALSLITTDASGDIKISSGDMLDIDAADKITIDCAGASGEDIIITNTGGSIILTATEEAADAIVLSASGTAGGITVGFGTGNMVITGTGASADFTLDCDLLSIDATGTSNITFTNAANEDVTISTAGAADHSLIIQATGTAADALQIKATAGGIDILASGAAANEDIDIIATGSSVNITSTENNALAIYLRENGGTSGAIKIHADQGTAQDSIYLLSDGGGVTIAMSAVPDGQYGLEVSSAIATATKSEGSAIYAHTTITGDIDDDTYNIGSWLDITGGTVSGAQVLSPLDIGVYTTADADLSAGWVVGLQIQTMVNATSNPAAHYMMRFNTNQAGDVPDAWFQAANPQSVAFTGNTVHTAAATDKIGAMKIAIVGYDACYIYVYSHPGQ